MIFIVQYGLAMTIKPPTTNRVLILTANTGGGHLSIAKAFEQIIVKDFPTSQVLILNTTPKASELFYRYIGNQLSTPFSAIWEWSNNKEKASILSQLQDFGSHSHLQRSILKFNPTLIISTEPFCIYTTQKILRELGLSVPHLVYVADPFSIHQLWASLPYATEYLCQTNEAKASLHEMGVPNNIISTTGFLVRSEYYQAVTKVPSNKITIFVGGSGDGGGNILDIVKKITNDKKTCKKIKLVIICGKNKFLKNKLKLLPSLKRVSHKVISYTLQLHKYLRDADFVVGKPGPNLLFESIMYLKPFIAIGNPLAQELGNYSYIDKERIGYSATNIPIAFDKIKLLVNDPTVLNSLIENMVKIRKSQINSQSKVRSVLTPYLVK